jgi:hypothetical protein
MILLTLVFPVFAAGAVADSVNSRSNTLHLDVIPPRSADAMTGTEFAQKTAGLRGRERQRQAIAEIERGNIPDFLRDLVPVRFAYKPAGRDTVHSIIWVTPDYLAIGSNEDYLRIPLTFPSALDVAHAFGCILPTRKIVDAIYEQATCRLSPQPLPPGPKMRSSEYYLEHQRLIETERQGCPDGTLVAGHKKDVVITNRLNQKSGRIAIYGWHRKKSKKPIQPLSTVHEARYADYSHGIRLVCQTVWVDGEERSIYDVLQDPVLGTILTYEKVITKPRRLMRLQQ